MLIFLIFYLVNSQNFCQRGSGIKTTQPGECLSSSKYDVENCCFEILQIDIVNQVSYLKCGSVYEIGFSSCSAESKKEALITAGSGAYVCLCNPGSNKSQVNVNSGSNSTFSNLTLLNIIFTNLSLLMFLLLIK